MLRPKPVSDSRILGVDLRRLGYFARPQTACPILDRAAAWTGNRIFSQPVEEPLDDDCRIRLSGTSSRFDQCIVYQVVDIRLGVRQGVAAPFCVGFGPLDQAPFAVLLDHMRQLLAHELTHVVQQNGEGRLVQRAETDTKGGCDTLADTKSDINNLVNNALVEARGGTAKPDPAVVIQGLFDRLGKNPITSPGRSPIENWASGLGPSKVTQPSQIDTKYAGVTYGLWSQHFFKILNPTMRVNDICIGSDKLGHFIELGFDYFAMAHSR